MQYLSHHIGVQRLISLNSMRIIIAIFEDVPFLGLNMYLLMREVDLANNPVFMVSRLYSRDYVIGIRLCKIRDFSGKLPTGSLSKCKSNGMKII